MLASIARYEIRFHLTRPTTWIYLVLFIAEGILFMGTDIEVLAGGGVGSIARNAPFSIAAALLTFAAINQVIVTGIVGTSVLRDYQYRTHQLLFTTSITKYEYLTGRFVGAFVVMVLLHLGMPLGLWIGAAIPWLDAARVAKTSLPVYFSLYATLVVPTLFLTSAIFFAVGATTRSLFAIYTQGLALLVVQLATSSLLANVNNQIVGALADPFGIAAFGVVTRYWTVAEKGSAMVTLSGLLLLNRAVWVAVGLAILVLTFVTFRFRASAPSLGGTKRVEVDNAPPPAPPFARPHQRFDVVAWRAQIVSSARLSFWSIVRQPPFIAIVAIGVILLFVSSSRVDALYAQPSWPLTYTMVEALSATFVLLFVLIVTMYAGEAVWRERELKADFVADALPVRTSVSLIGNLIGLALMEALLLALLIVVGVIIQTAKGYTHYELGLYLRYLYGTTFPSLVQLTVLALLVHTVVNQKFVGHAVMVLIWGAQLLASQRGVGHPLLRYAQTPAFRYSAFYGFGPFTSELTYSALYWSGVAGLIGVAALLLWVRGTETAWGVRLRAARQRWSASAARMGVVSLAVAGGAGGAIFYNTNVTHDYRSATTLRHMKAQHELRYKPLAQLDLPRLVAADIRADLKPENQSMALSGTFAFVNKSGRAIDSLVLTQEHADLAVDTLEWSKANTVLLTDSTHRTMLFRLATPLVPNDTLRLRYKARFASHGFSQDGPTTAIAANGTYFRVDWFPQLGYQSYDELIDPSERAAEGLSPRIRVASIDDVAARSNAYMLGAHADRITFHAVVSTAPDQIAVTPGKLVREYTENGRRVFEYASEAPMSNDYAVMSARYATHHERYRGVDLEVLFEPTHTFNIGQMVASMKASLDYFTAHFAPYQFTQLRVVEFPRYAQYALALPGTIPFSEAAGFIARSPNDEQALDMPFYVTAHEVAHQWWGHQVAGANVQGFTWLSEGLSNYSALTVMEKEFGAARLQTFLAFELDQYLLGRGTERGAERPLMLVEGQPYIHYNKGSIALYAYRDLIGEEAMNRALSKFLAATAFKGPPYPTSRDLVQYLEDETPDSLKYASTDLFKTITLWDNRTQSATATPRGDGTFDVRIRVTARKVRADSVGAEQSIPLGDLVDLGVFAKSATGNPLSAPLVMRKVWLRSSDTTYSVVVKEKPVLAGIDPYNKLIDRDRRDNVRAVTMNAATEQK